MNQALILAGRIAQAYAALPAVQAVAVAGSQTTGSAGPDSDIDLYIYSEQPVAVEDRRRIATQDAARAEVDNQYWEAGDEWIDRQSGIKADLMFRSLDWIEDQLERVLGRHEASVGYSTCFWHNILVSQALFDRRGWFEQLQAQATQPYPKELRRAIVAKNFPILSQALSSYTHQLEHAVQRGDLVSLNHRTAAFLASYFDILFAVNRQPHPGEKRLLKTAVETLKLCPAGMEAGVKGLLEASARVEPAVVQRAEGLANEMEKLLQAEGLLAGSPL